MVVNPRPGGAGTIAINALKALPPTGSDLAIVDIGHLALNPLTFKQLRYDPDRDLVPVALRYRTVFFIGVGADSPYRTLGDLASAGRSRRLSYGTTGAGGPAHLASATLASTIGHEMEAIHYRDAGSLFGNLAAGRVDWVLTSIAGAAPLVKLGKLRLLAVVDATRSPVAPLTPTLEEAGGPRGIHATARVAMVAPRGTPDEVVRYLNTVVNEALALPDVKERLATLGFTVAPGPAQQVSDLVRTDRAHYADVIRKEKNRTRPLATVATPSPAGPLTWHRTHKIMYRWTPSADTAWLVKIEQGDTSCNGPVEQP